jgi:hypothetical protein
MLRLPSAAWGVTAINVTAVLSGTGSTDNAVLRADGTAGNALQNSPFVITDAGAGSGLISQAIASGTITTNAPALDLSQTWNAGGVAFQGVKINATDTASASSSKIIDAQRSGTSVFGVSSVSGSEFTMMIAQASATLELFSTTTAPFTRPGGTVTNRIGRWDQTGVRQCSGGYFGWGSNSGTSNDGISSIDTTIYRDAANIVAQRNATTAQEQRVYNTFTSLTNCERYREKWASNVLYTGAEKGSGGGTVRCQVEDGAAEKALTESSATGFVTVACGSGVFVGGVIHYSIIADDASAYQCLSGTIPFSIIRASANCEPTVGTPSASSEIVAASSGTLTNTFTATGSGPTATFKANAVSSLTQTTLTIRYRVEIFGPEATVTPQ